MDLFEHNLEKQSAAELPLAARLRPKTLGEFVGQEHLVAKGRFLRSALDRDQVPSMILWGPPGTGKTTLAEIIANTTRSRFVFYSAVMGTVKDIREIVNEAKDKRVYHNQRTILFVDEIHRFNKSQQDAFLPFVERGVITLIGATTENPSFEVNAALLSRCKVLTLNALDTEALALVINRALKDPRAGLDAYHLTPEAVLALAESSFGDARRAITALELACQLAGEQGLSEVTPEIVAEAQQRKTLLYDKAGEEHYNVVSAFIKSLRGSDPDAAVYWMTRMLESGEDALFILRRMVIFASEDIGSADPQALAVAIHAMESFRFIGLPEGVLPMTQAATYLACAPKSNAVIMAYGAALRDVKGQGALPVPMHLRNAPTSLMKTLGYGRDYKYPHNFSGHYVPESYLPEALGGARYYEPSESGYEAEIKRRLDAWHATRNATRRSETDQNPHGQK